ncbi:hypothetical protein L3V43_13035 [Pseudoalteromonas sp. L23]|uniref:hypothetical protein n=1 Tax=unclassified Pseudoalteromonas TaxID=194690 RepID=UPI001EEFCBF6|nr:MULTISPECIES: hypothetical protein [unclassified Pseudoalteromonas]MCF7514646.1 hypothetical protein [Pseudoalteromonas sp. L7]MCF7526575.1 hypothetical protein [Pseudoalteromonas sp. L23]MCX2766285.1 hypothetical protein [Pseudoalteromonas sp. B530]
MQTKITFTKRSVLLPLRVGIVTSFFAVMAYYALTIEGFHPDGSSTASVRFKGDVTLFLIGIALCFIVYDILKAPRKLEIDLEQGRIYFYPKFSSRVQTILLKPACVLAIYRHPRHKNQFGLELYDCPNDTEPKLSCACEWKASDAEAALFWQMAKEKKRAVEPAPKPFWLLI